MAIAVDNYRHRTNWLAGVTAKNQLKCVGGAPALLRIAAIL
jgi:hypothetical protein